MPPLRIYTPRHTCRRGCTNTQLWEFWNCVLWWRAYRRGSFSRSSGAWLYRMCVFPILSIFFLVQKKRTPFKKAVSPFSSKLVEANRSFSRQLWLRFAGRWQNSEMRTSRAVVVLQFIQCRLSPHPSHSHHHDRLPERIADPFDAILASPRLKHRSCNRLCPGLAWSCPLPIPPQPQS